MFSSHRVAYRGCHERRTQVYASVKKQKRKKRKLRNNFETLHNACVEKRSMTRKVTACCLRKRLLLLPYTYKLYATHHVPSTTADKPATHQGRHYMLIAATRIRWSLFRTHTKHTFNINTKTRYIIPIAITFVCFWQLVTACDSLWQLVAAYIRFGRLFVMTICGKPLRVSCCALLKWVVGKNVPFVVLRISIFRLHLINWVTYWLPMNSL